MAEPSNRTIVLMDVEDSGRRLDIAQPVMRRMVYAVLHETLEAAGVEPTEYRSEDRGDGVFVLVHPSVPKPALLRALLTTAPERLFTTNRLAAESVRVRLRVVVHTGEVALDEHGASGRDLVDAFRLLDADALRDRLSATPEPSVLCVSNTVYQGVVRHGHHGVRPEHFHRFTLVGKEGDPLVAWYHDPFTARAPEGAEGTTTGRAAGAVGAEPDDAASRAPESGAAPAGLPPARTGNFFLGAARFGGDAVAGDKHVHAAPGEGRQDGAK
ncbi:MULTISPECIES: hypothetical protein [unclassified Streptomyces]|uniref:hypothetical protein n=1 Tax=unclassified Streptomyces TaxID=2593676 RepID=UPI00101260A0|nr:hypothetical protein [Streptomyces sp. GZWMJZ-114]